MVEEAEIARDHLLPVELQQDHQHAEDDIPDVADDVEELLDVQDVDDAHGNDQATCKDDERAQRRASSMGIQGGTRRRTDDE